ncbi:MAG: alpha/beta hydrolase [Hyphomicrobiaceae bacterium]|nr:alpha/beta hydrolase [Hyphomicrobiaceae bacterium]
MIAATTTQSWHDIFFSSQDGLRLYARHYPAPPSRRRPVLCLAGLTRNSRDFHFLASFLSDPANPMARDVVTLDYRGRGRSQHDPNWRNYSLQMELTDALDLLTVLGLSDVAVVGTSRGGLVAMIMACLRPTAIGAVVLNDIGPVIEREGLVRIIAYAGRMPLPPTWEDATQLVREINARWFPAVPDEHWAELARQWFNDEHGRPAFGWDKALAQSLSVLDGPIPELWPQFQALSRVPAMAIRGELSDILSEQTLREMSLRHPNLVALTVKEQGHAPLLRDRPTLFAINDFLGRSDPQIERVMERRRLTA